MCRTNRYNEDDFIESLTELYEENVLPYDLIISKLYNYLEKVIEERPTQSKKIYNAFSEYLKKYENI